MSIKLMSQIWEKELSHSEQCILLAMADYADDDGRNCYPSYERLAWKTGYSKRQVQRIIQGLCDDGVVAILKQPSQHQSTHYWIRIDKAVAKSPFRVDISDTDSRVDKLSTLNDDDDSSIDNLSTLNESRVDISDNQNGQGGHLDHPGWTNETSRVDMVSTDPSVNHQLETEEDDDDARDAVHQAWLDVLGIDVPANIEAPLQNLLVECGEPAVIHGIHASPQSGSRSFKFIAACARNYVPIPAESAASNSYHVDLPPAPPVIAPRPLAGLPPPVMRDDPLTIILSDLQRELPHDTPAHKWLKGSTLVQVADVAGIPLYHLCITDTSGVSWLSNRLAVDIRKKLSVLLRQRVLVEIVCLEAQP